MESTMKVAIMAALVSSGLPAAAYTPYDDWAMRREVCDEASDIIRSVISSRDAFTRDLNWTDLEAVASHKRFVREIIRHEYEDSGWTEEQLDRFVDFNWSKLGSSTDIALEAYDRCMESQK